MQNGIIFIGAMVLAFSLNLAAARAAPKSHSPASMECSKQADAKGLHGKARKKFRATCKKQFTPT
jgi:hypothetical protein